MLRLLPDHGSLPPAPRTPSAATPPRWALWGSAASRTLERSAAAALPPHTLMQRAAQAVARLARAWQPHAHRVLVLAGGGNNGGDGLAAAALLHQTAPARKVAVWWLGDENHMPDDARWALAQARRAGVAFVCAAPAQPPDLVIDALFGLGLNRTVAGAAAAALAWLQQQEAPTLCVDLPSGLDADSGRWWSDAPPQPAGPRLTLTLLTLKPGLFTGLGRAALGQELWFDDLGVNAPAQPPDAWLATPSGWPHAQRLRADHASHKGQRGDVLVLGGIPPAAHGGVGMTGAALLAGRAALRAGAGRVWVGLPAAADQLPACDPVQPALMLRSAQAALADGLLQRATVVAGCGAGSAMAALLPTLLHHAARLVLDADALNALAAAAGPTTHPWQAELGQRRARGWLTVLTPHPLEAARLLDCSVRTVQDDRWAAARTLAERLQAIVVLKGSGTVIAAPDQTPWVAASGSGWLATAGSGDVLAGLIGARLATLPACPEPQATLQAVAEAVCAHGALPTEAAGTWPPTASDLLPASGWDLPWHPTNPCP